MRRGASRRKTITALTLIALAGACSSGDGADSSSSSSSGSGGAGGSASNVTVMGRTTPVHLPDGYDASKPAPLLVMLHGYSVTAYLEELFLGFTGTTAANGFIYATPEGTLDTKGNPFWNATEACCNFFGSTVDDSAYLSALIEEIATKYAVDRKRVYLFGHSNGGFMAYRMACEHADQIAAVASLAGAMWLDPSVCKPTSPVAVLQSHGTEDPEILFGGAPDGTGGAGGYPSANVTATDWVTLNGCSPTSTPAAPQDFLDTLAGAETTIEDWTNGCQKGTAVTLWSMVGAGHIPAIGETYRKAVLEFLLAHPKQD